MSAKLLLPSLGKLGNQWTKRSDVHTAYRTTTWFCGTNKTRTEPWSCWDTWISTMSLLKKTRRKQSALKETGARTPTSLWPIWRQTTAACISVLPGTHSAAAWLKVNAKTKTTPPHSVSVTNGTPAAWSSHQFPPVVRLEYDQLLWEVNQMQT